MVLGQLGEGIRGAYLLASNKRIVNFGCLTAGNKEKVIQEAGFIELCNMLDAANPSYKPIKGKTSVTMVVGFQDNYIAASSIMRGLPPNIDDSGSHVILLKSLTDAGEIEMAIKYIEGIKMNFPFKLQIVLTELIASLSTAPNLEPVLQLLRVMHAQGLVSNDDPWMKMLEGDLLSTDSCV